MNSHDKQLQIDRMVDGELSANEQRELLMMCDSEDRWRELALAYVESQVFAKELNDFGQTTIVASEPNVTPVTPAPIRPDLQHRTESPERGWSVMSLAAVILLSLGFGYGMGWWLQGDASTPNFASNPSNRNPAATSPCHIRIPATTKPPRPAT